MTSFNYCADIHQLQVEDSFLLASDWIKSVQKSVKKEATTLLGSLL